MLCDCMIIRLYQRFSVLGRGLLDVAELLSEEVIPCVIGGERVFTSRIWEVTDPSSGAAFQSYSIATEHEVEAALQGAGSSLSATRRVASYVRSECLHHIAGRLREMAEDVAQLIVRESGKPLQAARTEVVRAIQTFSWAAAESMRDPGELLRMDTVRPDSDRLGMVRRFPLGTVLGISPFNFPLNLVAHKLAPAIAVGAPIIIKPSPKAPLTALLLGTLVMETELPAGSCSVFVTDDDLTQKMIQDPRIHMVSFTGSSEVGWSIRASTPRKRLTLELGGNATVLVHEDADLENAVERVSHGGFYQAGQSCISVQNVLVHAPIYQTFIGKLTDAVSRLRVGDPADETTDVGPLIDLEAARRVETWIKDASARGASVLCGGVRQGNTMAPAVITDVQSDMQVVNQEVFGPLVTVAPYQQFSEALALVNESPYGLQTGVFTSNVHRIFEAFHVLNVGGVIANDVSSYRADHMPYGGVKASGLGREGVKYAMLDMTEQKVLVLSHVMV
jgi:acyl-CoA reductase-like NAD-dependent aldehyde dehydrogenase